MKTCFLFFCIFNVASFAQTDPIQLLRNEVFQKMTVLNEETDPSERAILFSDNVMDSVVNFEKVLAAKLQTGEIDLVDFCQQMAGFRQELSSRFLEFSMVKSGESAAQTIVNLGKGTFLEITGLAALAKVERLGNQDKLSSIELLEKATTLPSFLEPPDPEIKRFHTQILAEIAELKYEAGDLNEAKVYADWYLNAVVKHHLLESGAIAIARRLDRKIYAEGADAATQENLSLIISESQDMLLRNHPFWQGETAEWEQYKSIITPILESNLNPAESSKH